MLPNKFILFINILTCLFSITQQTIVQTKTLQSLHVIFRHGDRTPDPGSIYPNDPHINETYYPTGLGELTLQGKRTVYKKVGLALRKRYDQFLGNVYTPNLLDARSSSMSRTKASLLLALAGLFPPPLLQLWNVGLHWQPIPTSYLPFEADKEFLGTFSEEATNLRKSYENSAEYEKTFSQYKDVAAYVAKYSGMNVTNIADFTKIYFALVTEDENKLKLPEWTNAVYPKPLQELAARMYYDYTATDELTQYAAGYMLQKILNDVDEKIIDDKKGTKLHLLSGHELNCANMLILLGVFQPHIPPYGSQVIFELHKINNIYGFKIYYQDFTKVNPQLLNLPNCDTFCPLDKFKANYRKFLPKTNGQL